MPEFEYKLVQAPDVVLRGWPHEQKMLDPLEDLLNHYGLDGWEYVRFEAVNLRERRWFWRDEVSRALVVVFRRQTEDELPVSLPTLVLPRAQAARPAPQPVAKADVAPEPKPDAAPAAATPVARRVPTIESAMADVHEVLRGYSPQSAPLRDASELEQAPLRAVRGQFVPTSGSR